jgi:hypothetical protein
VVPLFDSESFAFIGSADGELIVNCRKCRREAEAVIDTLKVALVVTCRSCEVNAEFKFRPSVHIAPATLKELDYVYPAAAAGRKA